MKNNRLPITVAWLGYGGLTPFLGLALLIYLDPAHGAIYRAALIAYGAVILSFVGALHWAFAMILPMLSVKQRASSYIWSVVPALSGWVSLLLPLLPGSLLLMLLFALHYMLDRKLANQSNVPDWYLPLRLRLTTVAIASLGLGALTVL